MEVKQIYMVSGTKNALYLHNLRGYGKNLGLLASVELHVVRKDSACILWIISELEKYFLKLCY